MEDVGGAAVEEELPVALQKPASLRTACRGKKDLLILSEESIVRVIQSRVRVRVRGRKVQISHEFVCKRLLASSNRKILMSFNESVTQQT